MFDEKDQINGETIISVKYKPDSVSSFQLDLVSSKSWDKNIGMKIEKITDKDGKLITYTHKSDIITLKFDQNAKPEFIKINYSGIPKDGLIISNNMYRDRTFFGDNWPNRAHYWLPCIDHPYEKATCEFIVIAPQHYQIVATGLKKEESILKENKKLTHYKNEVPLSTKVMNGNRCSQICYSIPREI